MKRFVLFAAAAVVVSACGPGADPVAAESISIPLETKTDGLSYAKGSLRPFTGEVLSFSKGNRRRSTESYHQGKPHGTWTRFWSNGTLKREESWEMGSLVHERQWYEDGVLKQDTEMKNGVRYGKSRFYWPNGRIRRVTFVGEGFKPHGHVLEYAEDGTILTDAIFQYGQYVSGKLGKEPLPPPVMVQAD